MKLRKTTDEWNCKEDITSIIRFSDQPVKRGHPLIFERIES